MGTGISYLQLREIIPRILIYLANELPCKAQFFCEKFNLGEEEKNELRKC